MPDQPRSQRQQNEDVIIRRLPPSLSIDSAHTPTGRPLTVQEQEDLNVLNRLKEFLATAPTRWSPPGAPGTMPIPNPQTNPALNRFSLPTGEYVTCVLWGGLYHITGTDIVRALHFRFKAFGRPVRNMKKFEEGIFSDLRNLKPGTDACLEEPKSAFLDLLYKYQCIRTQKKQKVFYWFSVPHDRLFLDALERDLKREKVGLEPSTALVGEPAMSFRYDGSSGKSLWEEWVAKVKEAKQGTPELADNASSGFNGTTINTFNGYGRDSPHMRSASSSSSTSAASTPALAMNELSLEGHNRNQLWGGMLELFEGSPSYKQRRKRRPPAQARLISGKEKERGRGVRKGSKDIDDDRDRSVGMGADTGPGARASSGDIARPRPTSSQSEMEMARRELEESLGRPAAVLRGTTASPPVYDTMENRDSNSPPNSQLGSQPSSQVSSTDSLAVAPPPTPQAGSVPYGATTTLPTTSRYQQIRLQGPHSQVAQQVAARHAYHPYSHSQPPQQHRHTLPSNLGPQTRSPLGGPSIPNHSNSLPPGMQYNGVLSRSGRSVLIPAIGANFNSKALVCPVHSCGKLFRRPDNWRRHMGEHAMAGEVDPHIVDDIVRCQVEIMPGAQVEDASDGQDVQRQAEHITEAPVGSASAPVDNPQFAHVVANHESSPFLSAQVPGSSTMSVSPVPWSGRPSSSSPGSAFSGPPSSHSPSPPQQGVPRAGPQMLHPAYSLQVPSSAQAPRSAPSYRQSFDQSTMLHQQPGISLSGEAGITRPRSATPSVQRASGSVSRPQTAMSYNGAPEYYRNQPGAVEYNPYPSAPATTTSYALGNALGTAAGTPSTAPMPMYNSEVQYQGQSSEMLSMDTSEANSEFHPSPEMDMVESPYVRAHVSSNQDTVALGGLSDVDYAVSEYNHMESPPDMSDMWGGGSYHPSPEASIGGVSPPVLGPMREGNPNANLQTGMTTEEAIQLFAES